MSDNRTNEVREVLCPACQSRPGAPCTTPTDTGRRAVSWVHISRKYAYSKEDAVPVVQQVSRSDALALVEEVIAAHADRIGTHFEDCYKYHVACLAVAVKRKLAGKRQSE